MHGSKNAPVPILLGRCTVIPPASFTVTQSSYGSADF